jgi:transposase-like protein
MLWTCQSCRHQTSVIAGTIFEGTHKPLTEWFRAIWWVTTQKNGASALGLQRVLDVSYKTAWTWLHKIRRAMVGPGRDRRSGEIEADETYIGAFDEETRGRELGEKALIVVAAQIDGKRIGRVRMRKISKADGVSLMSFIEDSVEPGSCIYTDGWSGYNKLATLDYGHKVSVIGRKKKEAAELLPRVHLAVSLLKRWLLGTHPGSVSYEHLDYYLDEFCFRFNRRTSRSRGLLFYRLLQQAMAVEPIPYRSIAMGIKTSRHARK